MAPHGTLDPRTAIEQLQFLVRAVRQRLVRQPEVDRDARFRARAHERVEDHQVVQLYGFCFCPRGGQSVSQSVSCGWWFDGGREGQFVPARGPEPKSSPP